MKLQNSIIASALVSFVCAAPFVEGRDDKAVVSSNSEHLESNSINFNNAGFVPRSVLRKRETEANNNALEAVDELVKELEKMYDLDWRALEEKIQEFAKKLASIQETVKTAKDGALEGKLAYIAKIIEGYEEVAKMEKIFDGCNYPGDSLVIDVLGIKVYALTAGHLQGKARADKIAASEKSLRSTQDLGEKKKDEEMVPGLRTMFYAKIEEVRDIIKGLKEDKPAQRAFSSETGAARDDKKTCPEIV